LNRCGKSIASMVESSTDDYNGNMQKIRAEIEAFKINFPVSDEESWVHSAVRKKQVKLVKLYRKLGASFDAYNYKRERPLDIAIKNKDVEMAALLLDSMILTREERETAQNEISELVKSLTITVNREVQIDLNLPTE